MNDTCPNCGRTVCPTCHRPCDREMPLWAALTLVLMPVSLVVLGCLGWNGLFPREPEPYQYIDYFALAGIDKGIPNVTNNASWHVSHRDVSEDAR